MLNTNVHVGGSHFNYHVNAVSGTLRKSHPKSKMIIRSLDTNSSLFSDEPKLYINRYKVEDVIILQTMLCGDNKVLVEYVLKDDFEEGWGTENA